MRSSDKVVGIYGGRGVGKTTLMLQIAKTLYSNYDELLYIACDHPLMQDVSLFDLIEYFYAHGGKMVVIDEIHESQGFEKALKSVYDFLDIKILFSGSSALQLTDPSFARRYDMKKLPVLSLREYIALQYNLSLPRFTLDALLSDHESIGYEILDRLEELKILKIMNEYLDHGAYPFYFVNPESYTQKMVDMINATLSNDIAVLYRVSPEKITILKKLLATICVSKPFELSLEALSKQVGITRATLYKYIDYLHRAELLRHVMHEAKRFKQLQKPDKLYLANPNLCKALCMACDKGTEREIFFANQLSFAHAIHYVERGDFLVDEHRVFEIGAKKKGFSQIEGIKEGYIAADDIEVGYGKKIPLWLFGFLY